MPPHPAALRQLSDAAAGRAAAALPPRAAAQQRAAAAAAAAGAAAEGAAEPDPVLELMGWKAEPLLRRRLKWYIAEAFVEAGSLALAMHVAALYLSPGAVFRRLTWIPLSVTLLKFAWCLRLALGYYRVRGRDVAVILRRLSAVHSRSCWSCSASALACLTCFLMLWHAVMFLILTSCGGSDHHEELASRLLMMFSAAFVVVNWLIWRDHVSNNAGALEEPHDARGAAAIVMMHRRHAIQLYEYSSLANREVVPTACVICLEEFKDSDFVEKLPCGHTFHPTCAHKWIMEDWRCPFRCSLDPRAQPQRPCEAAVVRPVRPMPGPGGRGGAVVAAAATEAPVVQPTPLAGASSQGLREAVAEVDDLEAGIVL